MDFPEYILKNHVDSDADFRSKLWASESAKRTELKTFTCLSIVNVMLSTIAYLHSSNYSGTNGNSSQYWFKINPLKKIKENIRKIEILKKQYYLYEKRIFWLQIQKIDLLTLLMQNFSFKIGAKILNKRGLSLRR